MREEKQRLIFLEKEKVTVGLNGSDQNYESFKRN